MTLMNALNRQQMLEVSSVQMPAALARFSSATTRTAGVLLLLAGLLVPTAAMAQNDTLTEVRLLYTAGLEAYDFFEYDTAEEKFDQAIEVAKAAGIEDPLVAKVYLAKGFLFHARFKDTALAVANDKTFDEFVKAISIDYNVQIPDDYKTDEIEVILKNAREIVPEPKNGGNNNNNNNNNNNTVKHGDVRLRHNALAVADACQPIAISASVPADPEAYRAYLHYRPSDSERFESVELQPNPSDPEIFNAEIPIEATTSPTIAYYLEVQNRQQAVVASVGSRSEPINVTVIGTCELPGSKRPIVHVLLSAGTGIGFANGDAERCPTTAACYGESFDPSRFEGVKAGIAPAPFHVNGEVLFNVIKELQIGLYTRYQIIEPALMIGAKLRYFILPDEPNRFYTGFGVGWGDAAYVVNLGPEFNNFKDIVRAEGPVHVGFNIGYMLTLHENFGLQFDVYTPIHFPNFTFHFDVNVGPFIQF
ncbi:MAG: hypothetical protein AUK47_21685 [Deltaproteobacteria bacterium CG2_30_63_29]|nr:MAG: hypothetical protein AUK47_21685 [Deltaproteobacteria bacterium CG2_30_63_29]PIW00043.1 MAG: hypothetical protein COW42_09100 [Deltaproteobacteria bacterium CG17_big_fil_post_rev_8_21_14_2_50_63_7]PJB46584.1 MAG: hypothetical protein CO108_05615 [Deltaproteobacteria bacterium CG_4_9_14_3_um_filter_63_12]